MADQYTFTSMMPGAQDKGYRADQYIVWGAGRAAALALAPRFSTVALLGNAAYMVTRLAQVYEVDLKTGAITGFVAGLATAVTTAAVSLLVPIQAVRIPVAVGLTFAIGKAANMWIEDGMPADISRYKPMLDSWMEEGKALAASFAAAGYQNLPQGGKDLWDGMENEANWYADKLKDQYDKKVSPAVEKWDKETKYVVHDKAAQAVSQVTDRVSTAVDKASNVVGDAAAVASDKASEAYATVSTKANDTKEALSDAVEKAQAKAADVKESIKDGVATAQATAGLAKDMAKVTAQQVKEQVANKLGK
jgi:hypothetical protein